MRVSDMGFSFLYTARNLNQKPCRGKCGMLSVFA
jgi:hypothetical protein